MYRVMVMFDPVQCVATPLDTRSGQPRPSYERSFVAITETGGARADRPDNQISSDVLRPGKKSSCMVSPDVLVQMYDTIYDKSLVHLLY